MLLLLMFGIQLAVVSHLVLQEHKMTDQTIVQNLLDAQLEREVRMRERN